MTKHTILFLAANPLGTDLLTLDKEARAIRVALERSGQRDRFELETRWAAQPLDLLDELRKLKPTVVHFSGHGGRGELRIRTNPPRDIVGESDGDNSPENSDRQHGLFFQGPDGQPRLVSAAALEETFSAAGASVRLVVLNACYSEAQAEALLAHVDCVVGMGGSIRDDAARSFAVGFYGGLGERQSVAAAYKQGRAAISVEGLPDSEKPRLRVRTDIDAAQVVLASDKVMRPLLRTPVHDIETISCPYPGMREFAETDADRFFGRDEEIDDLVGRLDRGKREIYVIGPSGSGKSSLVQAGLLHLLKAGTSRLERSFLLRTMRPGERPTDRLAKLLEGDLETPTTAIAELVTRHPPAKRLLLFVDQLEELFTLADAVERQRFIAVIRALRAVSQCHLVLALRADFYGALMDSELWPDRAGIARLDVAPLRGSALAEAITAPARRVGVRLEGRLCDRLVADAATEPGALPLVQETLRLLWDRRRRRLIGLAEYVS